MTAVEQSLGSVSRLRWWPLIGLAVSTTARGAVEFEPAISVGLAHTDNLTLAAENPETETIYQLIPELSLTQSGPRMTSDVDLRIEGYYYDDRSDSDVYQAFDAGMRAALDPENFFFELGASRDQTIRDPEAPIPRSNLPITGNRVDRDDYYAGPTFEYPIGANATVSGSYRRNWVRYDDDEAGSTFVRDFENDSFTLSVDNYLKERGLTWAASYSADETDYGVFMPWEYRQATLEIGAWASEGLRLFAAGGKESAWDDPFDPSLEDNFWEAGFAKHAGQSLTVEFAAGERTFGSSKRAMLDYAFARGQAQLRYTEQPTSQGRDPYRELPLPEGLPELDDFLDRPGVAERYILKRLDWSLSFDLRRTGFAMTVFDESREDRTQIDGTPLEDEAQTGGFVTVSWQAGARTELELGAERIDREFGSGREQNLRSVSLGANYSLGTRTELAFVLSRSKEDSGGGPSGLDYTADLISLLLTRTF